MKRFSKSKNERRVMDGARGELWRKRILKKKATEVEFTLSLRPGDPMVLEAEVEGSCTLNSQCENCTKYT